MKSRQGIAQCCGWLLLDNEVNERASNFSFFIWKDASAKVCHFKGRLLKVFMGRVINLSCVNFLSDHHQTNNKLDQNWITDFTGGL